MEYGRLEVDGPPPDGRERWGRHDLQGGATDLTGHRRVLGQGSDVGSGFRLPLGLRADSPLPESRKHDLQGGVADLTGYRHVTYGRVSQGLTYVGSRALVRDQV